MATLPAIAVAPVLFGPAFVIGSAHELLRHGEAAPVVAGATALLAGLATVGLAATYALRPTTPRVERRPG